MRTLIKPNEIYGNIEVLEVYQSEKKPKTYVCRCKKCNNNMIMSGQEILKYQVAGCAECRKKEREEKELESLIKEYIGKKFGKLKITKILPIRMYSSVPCRFVECNCDCGSSIELPLSRLKAGQSKMCKNCTKVYLQKGWKKAKEAIVEGTNIVHISGNRKENSNNTTGVTGVSQFKNGHYRAYIVFKRKAYHLGCYENLEDAVNARKAAEKKIFGNFLEWYKDTYPEKWEEMNNDKEQKNELD